MSVLDKLKAVQLAVRANINNVNAGGCCVLAAAVGEELEALGIETQVIVDDLGGVANSIEQARESVQNNLDPQEWEKNGVLFNHVGLRFKLGEDWHTFDADAIWKDKNKFGTALDVAWAARGWFTVQEAEAFSKVPSQWNPWFNRRQIPLLKTLVKQAFKEA